MFREFEINEGIKLHYLKDERFKTTTTAVFIRNMLSDKSTKTALWAELLRGGCRKYPSMRAMWAKLEEMWGSAYEVAVIKRGDEQLVYIYLEGLTKTFDEGINFLQDIIFDTPMKSERLLKRAKERLEESIDVIKDNKADYSVERMTSILAKDTDFGVPVFGYKEKISPITCEEMLTHYEELLKTAPIDIYVVGSEKEDFVVKRCKEAFAIERGAVQELESKIFKEEKKQCEVVVEDEGNNQGRLCMAFSVEEEDTKNLIPLLVVNETLGGGGDSRLFSQVREKEGLCYSIGSFVFKQKMLLVVQAGIDESSFEKVCEMTEKAMKDISGNMEEKELEKAKDSLIKTYESSTDIPGELINFHLSMKLSDLNLDIDGFREEVNKVSLEDVKELAKGMNCELKYFLK